MKLPNKFFITGTDTEVGKTYVACKLVKILQSQDRTVSTCKPLVSGGLEDIRLLSQGLCSHAKYLHCFEPAIAPHIAAEASNIKISKDEIVHFMKYSSNTDHTLIEGFGGWYAPISKQVTMAECVAAANIPVVLVVGMKLGCINHAILTARAITNDGCMLTGWIANRLAPPFMPYLKQNIETISELLNKAPMEIF